MGKAIIFFVRSYQRFMEPLWSQRPLGMVFSGCRFYPSCSEYACDAILANGALRGAVKGIARILRCNPFSAGGIDMP